jgi:hypothetical protein
MRGDEVERTESGSTDKDHECPESESKLEGKRTL